MLTLGLLIYCFQRIDKTLAIDSRDHLHVLQKLG